MNREEPNQQRRTVELSGLTFHENYTPNNLANDVAIISLPTPVTLNQFVQIVNLPGPVDISNDFAGELAVASGWGRFSSAQQSSEFLRFVNVNVITNTACRIRFPGIIQDSTSEFGFVHRLMDFFGFPKFFQSAPLVLVTLGTLVPATETLAVH
jgi:Trypsin